jgi:hypothetical protein
MNKICLANQCKRGELEIVVGNHPVSAAIQADS